MWCVIARNKWKNEARKTDTLTIAAKPEDLDKITAIFMQALKAEKVDVDYFSCPHEGPRLR